MDKESAQILFSPPPWSSSTSSTWRISLVMDREESVLDTIIDGEDVDEFDDAEMMDVEEGEFVEENSNDRDFKLVEDYANARDFKLVEENLNARDFKLVEDNLNARDIKLVEENSSALDLKLVEENSNAGDFERSVSGAASVNQECAGRCKNKRRKRKKNKKNKRSSWGCPDGIDVNRFVMDVCRFLREKKSYLVYSAVGCLGVSALNDLVKEVDAIQACGGQMIPDGSRWRTGGGILWNILKTRDPNVYKEIMKQGREFEKQFKHPSIKREPVLPSAGQSSLLESDMGEEPERSKFENHDNELQKFTGGDKRTSVHDRLRVPVSYSDLLEKENADDERVHDKGNLHNARLVSSSSSVI